LIGSLRKARAAARLSIDRFWRGRAYQKSGCDDIELHLREAVEWLVRAQDAGDDRGVSYGVKFGGPFLASYPETTGYIIPTFLALADYYGDASLSKRAVEMGEWESGIQLESGAVMGGMLNSTPTPAVFNTGMVLLGWSALHNREPSPVFLDSLQRAGKWLIDMQDSDGNWLRGNSRFANANATVYNVKAAWGLCEAGKVAGMPEAIDAATLNAEFAISRQTGNGWFRDCSLTDPDRPLLHTIAYAMQGLIGIGVITSREDLIEAARRTADSLVQMMDDEGFIPGYIGQDFQGLSDWCCLTGTAQTAIVWGRLFELTNDTTYLNAMDKAISYLVRHHDITNNDSRLRGGVPGSWPVWGEYGRTTILNWATNFFVEALLLRLTLDR
jgi:hypothetical protein